MSILVRPARREDAPLLARLVDMAGEGLPRHFWAQMAGPGEDVWQVGARRAARDEGAFSWRNAWIAEIGSDAAGGLVAYPVGDVPEPLDDLPPIVRPLQALENRALGSFYVNVLATVPDARRRGVARRLMAQAEEAAGARNVSLIVASGNAAALALYHALGFAEEGREPLVRDGWETDSAEWVLMVKTRRGGGEASHRAGA